MRYPENFIEELRQRADLVRIIEPYAPLKKKGANWMGCCPFHQEKTPSFSVNPAKGFYKCFGCGKGGNAFSFVMEIEGLSFPEAIKKVAEVSGVPLPAPVDDKKFEFVKKKKEAEKKIADAVIELNQFALEFWEHHLGENVGKQAREYLEKRGIPDETRRTFRIGYAPDSWDALMSHLKSKGADEKLIEQSGLVSVNEEKKRVYDRFRGRLMFPVLNVEGKPVAFGARILDKGEPKYLNSPETPAYIKGEHLYGLFQNKEEIRRKKSSILVEGYLDLIALHQAGVRICAASLGTAFTPQQAKLLGRFARKIVVNYDGDSAGVKAARRAIETLLAENLEIDVLVLPSGQDPDDFIRANGIQAYRNQYKNAFPYLQFVLENATRERNLALPKQKADAIEDVLPVISAVRNPIQKRDSFDQAMNFLRVEDAVLKRDLWRTVKLAATTGGDVDAADIRRTVSRHSRARLTVAEQHLLEFIIHDAELRSIILPQLEETDFEALATSAVFRALLTIQRDGKEFTAENLTELVSEDAQAEDILPILLMSEPPREPDEAIDEILAEAEKCVFALRGMAIANRILEISQELVNAEQTGDFALRDQLVREQIDLARLKHELEKANMHETGAEY
ncbi:MAG TPA: DNA primase [Pyrinomonadaceae bacterium]|nr:DNA primase [Pyrinomonadaceae bacterium]